MVQPPIIVGVPRINFSPVDKPTLDCVAGLSARHSHQDDLGVDAAASFTARETQILQLIADGLSCRDITRRLAIREATVRKHRSNMLAKLGLHNAAQLVAHAGTQGWLAIAQAPSFRHPVGA